MAELVDAVVVVTGGASGVGRALAREAARRGADVVVVDVEDTAETTELIAAAGGRARGLRGDVRDLDELRALAAEIGRVDVVCPNAGTGVSADVDHTTTEDFRRILDVNVVGVFHTVQAFLPALRHTRSAGRPAAVLITGSEHSLGVPWHVQAQTAYTTSKHALLGFAACLRRDLADDGIAVSLLCPGFVRTEKLLGYATARADVAEMLEKYGQDSDEVARLALDGLADAPLVIPTNPVTRDFALDFHRDVIDAVEKALPK